MKLCAPFFAILLSAVFTIQILDVPPVSTAKNPKTCCGRQICRCTHAPGVRCDFDAKKSVHAEKHAECRLHKSAVLKQKTSAEVKEAKIRPGTPFFAHAPCSTNESKAAVPGMMKEYLIHRDSWSHEIMFGDDLLNQKIKTWISFEGQMNERPPRFFLFTL